MRCAAGTILTEAALIATNTAPGSQRSFAFEKLRFFNASQFKILRGESLDLAGGLPDKLLFGNDISAQAVAATAKHLQNILGAEAMKRVQLTAQRAETIVPSADAGLVLSNPPYGERLDELHALREWYPALGTWMKRELAGWTVCFITADRDMPRGLGYKPSKKTPFYNGALDCRLFEFQMYAGSKRTDRTESAP